MRDPKHWKSLLENGYAMSSIAAITGTGMFVPEKVLTNKDLEKIVNTSDEWISSRTGMKKRRLSGPDEPTSELCIHAARQAIQNAGIQPDDVDMIMVATISGDKPWPATAAIIQKKLGICNCPAFDISAACSGFLYAMDIARHMITTGAYRTILVISADELAKVVNWKDRTTCVLFGDGAGAAILQPQRESGHEILDVLLGCDGTLESALHIPGGGTQIPVSHEMVDQNLQYIHMNGQDIFKHATRRMCEATQGILERLNLSSQDIQWVVPHQANIRIIEAMIKRTNLRMEQVVLNVQHYGNMSGASLPVALHEGAGRFQSGDLILLVAFGSGLTWGASVIRW